MVQEKNLLSEMAQDVDHGVNLHYKHATPEYEVRRSPVNFLSDAKPGELTTLFSPVLSCLKKIILELKWIYTARLYNAICVFYCLCNY